MASRNNRKPGVRVGNYRITPLGLITLGILLLIIIIVIVLVVVKPMSGGDGLFSRPTPTPTPVPTIDPASITPTPSPSPTPSPTPEPEPRTARIRALGEIAIEQNLLKAATTDGGSTFDFSEMFSLVSDIIGDADYTVADVEGTLGGTQKVSGSDKIYTPPILIQNLKDCGVDMLDLANDHALDGNFDELKATIANCQSAGMDYVGAATTKEEKNTPKIVDINGIKVAFVAYTTSLNVKEKKVEKDALKYVRTDLTFYSNKNTEEAEKAVYEYFVERCGMNLKTFANARDIRNFYERAITNQANRLASIEKPTTYQLATLTIDDVTGIELN